jgi:hypothetical protein
MSGRTKLIGSYIVSPSLVSGSNKLTKYAIPVMAAARTDRTICQLSHQFLVR